MVKTRDATSRNCHSATTRDGHPATTRNFHSATIRKYLIKKSYHILQGEVSV